MSGSGHAGNAPESVWDYPRPPSVEPSARRARVLYAGVVVADTVHALRVLETSHPPTWYLPAADVRVDLLSPTGRQSFCEFKGFATYWSLRVDGSLSVDAAWSYPDPRPGYERLRDHLAFYPGRVDACFVDDEPVLAQEGDFYGGWITSDVVGPFKGGEGTRGW
ncbi:MAG TPA: DUF427 domain-containing protein [Actinomycetes bacterium]|nr:DUF427 domain-containing protein [Actinomycetes bacterium]